MTIINSSKCGLQFIELKNSNNFKVVFTNLGASIYQIYSNNYLLTRNVKDIEDFKLPHIYYGKTIGRVANRIRGNKLKVHDSLFELEANEGKNVLHGGYNGISNKLFEQDIYSDETKTVITYTYTSPDLESGFPGNLSLKVIYVVYEYKDVVEVSYIATCDEDTPVSLTNHTYFTLGCKSCKYLDLYINSKRYLKCREDLTYLNEEDTPDYLDFSEGKKIGKDISNINLHSERLNGYDHYFYFVEKNEEIPNVSLSNSKFKLNIYTDFEGVQIYTSGFKIKEGLYLDAKEEYDSVAIEPSDSFAKVRLLKKDKKYLRHIKYEFIRKD